MEISSEIKTRLRSVINTFENDSGSADTDYSSIYIYKDGPNKRRQITLGFGITEYGNMKKLLELYIAGQGKFAKEFAPYVGKVGSLSNPLVNNKAFIALLVRASKEDQEFRDAEDAIFETKYFDPMIKFAEKNGFKENLSLMVLLDSFIHSGSIRDALRSRFPENVPANGGNERKWIQQYVEVRQKWLATHSNPILHGTVYRTKFLLGEIKKGNWKLDPPLVANGTKINV